ncbi:hypothetical protein Taro_044645 [Colocasia esculenta]|uniref:Uncharacterized protein n=1 Tax=Colocasia esculenta TaxID=4460 RepID=A0A843WJS0_COLES|nr:hypothetical protein [Colocasia esculenta]
MADASVELKEHQNKLEIVLQGILANSQADVFNTKQTLSEISKTRLSFAHLVDNMEGTNIFCKGNVDTTILGVDTMVQNKGRNVKKSSSQVDTSPKQVDTRDLSQGLVLPVWDNVSTHPLGRSTHSGISVT